MVEVLLLTLGVYVFGNFGGYIVHRLLHCKWMGRAYRDHHHHHFTIYPPEKYLSDEYLEPPIEAGQAKYYLTFFAVVMSPLILWHWAYFLLAFVEAIIVLKANSVVHDALHVRGHKWEKYAWFMKLRDIHFHHHVDVGVNFGIFSFFADRLMRTYR